jgi:Zn-dependent peptidase ImmA (M78 family)/transcriptional regulator with XRE-family HTH domain
MPTAIDTTTWVAERIRDARRQRGWSQAELAERLGLTQTAISYWEAGKRAPGLDELLHLAEVLDQDVSFFLPRGQSRAPIRAVLRATAERLDHVDLNAALLGLVDELEEAELPARELTITSVRPVAAAKELLANAAVTEPPVDVEQLTARCGALLVRRRFDDALSGLMINLDDRALIAVNDLQSDGRQRFTIGHELGHLLLGHHHRFHIDLGPSAEHGNPPGHDWRHERAANDFAAELLMPTTLVHDAFERTPSISDLAELFEVSEIAMGYRLANLHLR